VESLGVLDYAFAALVVTVAYAVRSTAGFGGPSESCFPLARC
jgi:hypothetical protein